jgi:2-oxoglutarate ferredoxin oxidoreductase subunit gamma
MHEEVIVSGFGGQGALFAGQLMTYAGMSEGRMVSWIPSYGPEMRGGTAHCTVIISDEPIGSPIIHNPKSCIVLNPASMEKYEPLVRAGGVLVVNTSLVRSCSERTDITVVEVPANDLANEIGSVKIANIVLLGALLAVNPIVSLESVKQALDEHIPEHRRHIIAPNKQALERGAEVALGVKATS